MTQKLFNTLTRQKQIFTPIRPKDIGFYTCGPTVYNFAHIGNFRAYVAADTLRRWLVYGHGMKVKWVLNITDIDDKTIKGAREMYPELDPMSALKKFTSKYEKIFFEDLEQLHILRSDFFKNPKATDFIPQMQSLIRAIYDKGYAKIINGSVFFDVAKWSKDDSYGKLLSLDLAQLKTGTRTLADETEKDNLADFVLWKAQKSDEPAWEFELGGKQVPGRPGWHLECSAMEKDILGLPFDIHSGGVDLVFPHHEDEIAQSACGYGREPTRYWLHNEHLLVDSKKMSKSLGNFFTLRDLVQKGFDPEVIRFFLVTNHYRTKLNLSDEALESAGNALHKIRNALRCLVVSHTVEDCLERSRPGLIEEIDRDFREAMNDDLNAPVAIAAVHRLVAAINEHSVSIEEKQQINRFFSFAGSVFGVDMFPQIVEIPEEIKLLAEQRQAARNEKHWQLADELRGQLLERGFEMRDAADGYKILPVR